jgi:hypothetical protein
MTDYYQKTQNLAQDKLHEEIKRINDQLAKTNQSSPMFNQLLNMLETAQGALDEKMAIERSKNQKDSAINIGSVESTVIEPDYDRDEILDAVVTAYTKNLKDNT